MRYYRSQRGVALITALLVVSLATVLAVALVDRLHLDISRSENIIHHEQSYLYALSLENIAHLLLQGDAQASDYDSREEIELANQYLSAPMEGGEIVGEIIDLQGRFNLNNLSPELNSDHARDREIFMRLLSQLELDRNLVTAIVDWLDSDSQTSIPGGAENDYYLAFEQSYRAANTLLVSPSELRMIRGFEKDETYAALEPFIIALPKVTSININTAPAEVLKSLDETITDDDVTDIVARQENEPFEDIQAFKTYMETDRNKKNFSSAGMTVVSDYFLLSSDTRIGRGKVLLYSIFQRDKNGSLVVSRSQGAW
ncbi:MAG: type II secretion system minor pseudopilin GspK [Gammaproteobacteria bacterium]|nr:type II secretion system minor pseudopilin GspK [Gammaproteobacteria bacterium]